MADAERTDEPRRGGFWLRFTLTSVLACFPLAYGAVVYRISPVSIAVVSLVFGVSLLFIWDGLRWLPKSLMFWAKPQALHDEATGLYNVEAWKKLLAAEEDRCKRYDLTASVLVVKLTGPKGQHTSVAEAMRVVTAGARLGSVTRGHDVVSCLAEDRFAILAVNCRRDHKEAFVHRVRTALGGEGIEASYGIADRETHATLEEAWAVAEREVDGQASKPVTPS